MAPPLEARGRRQCRRRSPRHTSLAHVIFLSDRASPFLLPKVAALHGLPGARERKLETMSRAHFESTLWPLNLAAALEGRSAHFRETILRVVRGWSARFSIYLSIYPRAVCCGRGCWTATARAAQTPTESARNIWRARMVMPIVHVDAGAGADPPTAHELVRRRAAVCFAVVCTLCPSLAHSKPYARLGFIIFTNKDQSDLCTFARNRGCPACLCGCKPAWLPLS